MSEQYSFSKLVSSKKTPEIKLACFRAINPPKEMKLYSARHLTENAVKAFNNLTTSKYVGCDKAIAAFNALKI